MLLERCVCGEQVCDGIRKNGLDVRICSACGLARQDLDWTSDDLVRWYREEYRQKIFIHDRDHDLEVARDRVRQLGLDIEPKRRILDIGTGSGAFLQAAKDKGHSVVGTEFSYFGNGTGDVYHDEFPDIYFPTDHFDYVTFFDVLEHCVDPVKYLEEAFRVVRQNGIMIVEIPDFGDPRHWKHIEHLHMLFPEHVDRLAESVGFCSVCCKSPIEGRFQLVYRKPVQKRTSILVPPGMGDAYWSLVKLQSFLKDKGLGLPNVHAASLEPKKDRSLAFLRKHPFIKGEGYARIGKTSTIWNEAYMQEARTVFEDVFGFDYFLAYNGQLRFGHSMEEIDPQWECNWDLPMFVSSFERKKTQEYTEKYGRYMIGYVVTEGPYKKWLDDFSMKRMRDVYLRLAKSLNIKVILIGSTWDVKNPIRILTQNSGGQIVDLIGKTSIEEVFALMRGSVGILGYPSGITIMSTVFGIPSLVIWNDYYHKDFWWNAMPSDSHRKHYEAVNSSEVTEDFLVQKFHRMVECKL